MRPSPPTTMLVAWPTSMVWVLPSGLIARMPSKAVPTKIVPLGATATELG